MRWLCAQWALPARLLLTIHDEIRFVVAESHQYRTCLALQLAHLYCRAFFAARLGMHELPLGVAFFSGVDVDRHLRKDPANPSTTITSPDPLAPGRSLTIDEIVERAEAEGPIVNDERVVKELQKVAVKDNNPVHPLPFFANLRSDQQYLDLLRSQAGLFRRRRINE